MKKQYSGLFISGFLLFILSGININAQDAPVYGKSAFSFNITRSIVNEANMSFEYWLNYRKSIEFNGGLIYVNEYLKDQAKGWNNAVLFSEHGYAARFYLKNFKRQEETGRWRDYIAYGISYKHLYYNNLFIHDDIIKYDNSLPITYPDSAYQDSVFQYTEDYYRDGSRDKIGVEFIWGKVYEMNKTFAFEFYYGAGITATMATHKDYLRHPIYLNSRHQWLSKPIPDFTLDSFYLRPIALLGVKFRIRF